MSGRPSLLVSAALAGALVALPAHAAPDASKFSWTDLAVINANDLLSGWPVAFNHGETLSFNIRTTVQAKDFAEKGFRIRFFRADENWNPLPYQRNEPIPHLQFPPCDVYLSGVWSDIRHGRLGELGWLSAGQTGRLEDGRWLLIFETKVGSGDARILRLDRANKAAYFAFAAKLLVKANGDHTVGELPKLTPQNIADIKALKAEATVNAPSRYCMHLRKFTDAPTTTLAQLDSCLADAPPG